MANEVKYDLGIFEYDSEMVVVEEFTLTDKITVEKYKPSHLKYSSDANTTEHELTWEVKGVSPEFYPFFKKIVDEQDKSDYVAPDCTTYDYDVDGTKVQKSIYKGCFIEELPEETANKKFDVSGIALSKVKPSRAV